jgi:hypothetical protein
LCGDPLYYPDGFDLKRKEAIMIVAITSPDVLSIGMFTDFLAKGPLRGAAKVNLNGLLSEASLLAVVEAALADMPGRDIIFRHKTRRWNSGVELPTSLVEKSDCVIGFDLYSTHPEVLKNFPGWTENVVSAFEVATSGEGL